MLNHFAKFLLVATSLSPLLGAIAVNQFALGKPWPVWLPWLVAAVLLVLLCWLLLVYAAKSAQKQSLTLDESPMPAKGQVVRQPVLFGLIRHRVGH